MNFTSRSAIETYWTCPRKRYLQYFYDGIGIVPSGRSIPLTTGTCVHAGIEHMARWLKKRGNRILEDIKKESEEVIEEAVEIGKQIYLDELIEKKFHGKGVETDQQQEFTKGEQLALTEALIRAWGLRELPNINHRFLVYDIEREIAVSLTNDITLESRCDMLLRERVGKDIYCYSLKTTKEFTKWIEKGYKDDLQGLLEMWAAEHYLTESNRKIRSGIEFLNGYLKGDTIKEIEQLLDKKLVADAPMGVKFCFLVKGKREEEKENGEGTGFYRTINSLIRGYRKFSTSGIEYAHSMYFPNNANSSGYGRLGKGWEPFNVWTDEGERVGGVKGWVEMLDTRTYNQQEESVFEIQPECGDVIGKYVVTPVEVFRDEREIKDVVAQVTIQENKIFNQLLGYSDNSWTQNRRSCHYPTDCEYIPICYLKDSNDKPVSIQVREDPIGSGWYEKRRPHHEKEKEEKG